MAALRTDCFSVGHQIFGNNLLFVFQLEFYYLIFPLSTAQAAVARLQRAQRAWGSSWNVARTPAFSLESLIHRPKRRKQEKGLEIACMSAKLPKRDSCSLRKITATGAGQLRYGRDSIRPLLMKLSASIIPLRSPPLKVFFCKKHFPGFLMAVR